MAYLLTTGLLTRDLHTYIRDLLYLNLKVLPSDVPFNTKLGMNRLQMEESVSDYRDKISTVINRLLDRINARHNVTLSIIKIEVTTSEINIEINLNNLEADNYSIPILN